ncbi:ABC transporter ATP-binding protein [Candidatus Borrarchaeum sp.]|uniref:ABC transporter ATP-binding protein n=1 Tax=Candidatus Borrarchaeum sp. TaxID=2846742 RepID=UPI0025797FE2|nr:ABC transporter ATP-binding protein [Candidatus Borrarchaeum sp.]
MVELSVTDASFSYAAADFSLRNISFQISSGEICCLLGPNASGKTTLIKFIAQIIGPGNGRIFFDDRDLLTLQPIELAKLIAYVPQIHIASFPYKVIDMVLMGRNPYVNFFSAPKKRDLEMSTKALSILGLEGIQNRIYTELSGGQQKLVLMARALAQETPLMLLDEPTAHLDIRNSLLILNSITKLVKEKKIIVLMALHDPNEALLVADKVVMMKDGQIIAEGIPKNVLTPESIKEIYDVRVEIVSSFNRRIVVSSLDSLL